jgi:crotonobetainyl-CoA:carnitine CoA-transferase CaiB-like acyl-CoA transferase
MVTTEVAPGPLDGIRVIDLTTARGELAGRIWADLGADVIKVEPPGGSPSRRTPPFIIGREDDGDASLFWAATALGKRSVVLDIDDPGERERLKHLIAGADVLVESSEPGHLARFGLGYEAMRELNPSLLYVSITPFGQSGPHAALPATDLTVEAASGLLGFQGDRDRPPVPVGYPQSSFHGAAQAAADAIIAMIERDRSGLGQHLDTSMQAAVIGTLLTGTGAPPLTGRDPPRTGAERGDPPRDLAPGVSPPTTLEVADGQAVITPVLGDVGDRSFGKMMRWAADEGALDEDLHDVSWSTGLQGLAAGGATPDQLSRGLAQLLAFFRGKTKHELQERAVAEKLLLAPLYTTADLLVDPQLQGREYWREVGGRTYPGPFALLSRTPIRHRAPAPELGADQHLLESPRRPAAPAPTMTEPRPDALSGIKVADFAWVGAGPLVGKALADYGATVVRIESETRLDVLRVIPPFKDNVPGINRGHPPANFNTSKLGLALNLATEHGRSSARRLIDWSDVVLESFTPGTMARFGFDYETLSKERPDLIMFSSTLRGQTGDERAYTGFGAQGAALAGLGAITGWPDRPPVGPHGAYTDFVSPRYGIAALVAAIRSRQRTGQGQYIDHSQVESAIHFLEPLVLDYTANGRVAGPAGHDSDRACPHGVYQTAGVERYVAMAVETPQQWHALRSLASIAGFGDAAFDDLGTRIIQRDTLDAILRPWCRDQDPLALERRLTDAGIPAHIVARPTDLYDDTQLAHRGFFVTLDHQEIGLVPLDGLPTQFSETPGRLRNAGPCLGQDTEYVLREILGMASEEIAELASVGALS